MPSPTTATRLSGGLQALDLGGFLVGQDLGQHPI